MTAVDAPAGTLRAGDGDASPAPPPAERGTTTIAPAVFEKIAVRVAAGVPGVEGEVRTGPGRFLPWTGGAASVDADADVEDEGVDLDLSFNVAYPEPVRQVAARVRGHVAERVAALTGRRVRRVDITVVELVAPRRRRPRVR